MVCAERSGESEDRGWFAVRIEAKHFCGGAAGGEGRALRIKANGPEIGGTPSGVAVRSDGRLELAPKFTRLADGRCLLSLDRRLDSKGAPFAAGGSPQKVFRFDSNGKPTAVFDSPTSPHKPSLSIPRAPFLSALPPMARSTSFRDWREIQVFFDPKTKYIWDLALLLTARSSSLPATKARSSPLAPDGKARLFYASDEAHIRVLASTAPAI